jgi:hypothetical protein
MVAKISVLLDGGIGNLLFQYAASLTLQSKYGYEVSLGAMLPGLTQRLESYVGQLEAGTQTQPSNNHKLFSSQFRSLNKQVGLEKLSSPLTTKWSGDFLPCEAPYPGRVRVLKGYFQHPSWFAESLNEVLERLTLERQEIQHSIPSGLTSIHLRRSDYVRLGWDLPFAYYEKSFESNPGLFERPVAVFSDDKLVKILMEKELARMGANIFVVPFNSAKLDFFTMSLSRNIVMSNSTFCWWATKLASIDNPDLSVICPETWLPDDYSNELIDPKWTKVKYLL